MPINPAIEEKIVELAKTAHRFIACGQPDCEGCTYENNELVSEIRTALQDIYQLGVSDGEERTKNEQSRDPLPCPHGREPMGGQDGWKHCPHCLGLNSN